MNVYSKIMQTFLKTITTCLKQNASRSLNICFVGGDYAASIKFVHPRPHVHVLFFICFSLCFTHGYMPADMMETTIVAIIKNRYCR